MTMQKVERELIKGVPSFNHLMDIIKAVIDDEPYYHTDRIGLGSKVSGYLLKTRERKEEFWCGINMTNPTYLGFEYKELADLALHDDNIKKEISQAISKGGEAIGYPLPPEINYSMSPKALRQLHPLPYWLILPFEKRFFFDLPDDG